MPGWKPWALSKRAERSKLTELQKFEPYGLCVWFGRPDEVSNTVEVLKGFCTLEFFSSV